MMVVNGWSLYGHRMFTESFELLTEEVEGLAEADPHRFHHHPAYKLLIKVRDCVYVRVPSNPDHADFRGGSMFKGNTHWRRAKHGMPTRYRLFFQFRSDAPKSVIYAWFNDQDCLRQDGSKRDCYAVFTAMVANGKVPNNFRDLLAASKPVAKLEPQAQAE